VTVSGSVEVAGAARVDRESLILTGEALEFVGALQREFGGRREELLARRVRRRAEIAGTHRLDFLAETRHVRESDWQVAPAPPDLRDRRVEITGPPERKMTINALNSGAKVWLADLEDANTPHWANVISSQVNLFDAVRRQIEFTGPDGRRYELRTDAGLPAIVMRPRGWHLPERHVVVDGSPAAGALVDFGLYFFHNAAELLTRGSGPYFYLPKMESHLEARLWNDVFTFAQQRLGIPVGTIRATVLIETFPAAFEMEEILYELRSHVSGLNAGRWDYLFSIIKCFHDAGAAFVLPERNSVTMTAPMMRAYTELLVRTCHKRGAFAIGGMAAFVPSRRDPQINERALAKVSEDKRREAGDGFDGSWVAHPDLVPVCREVFDGVLGERPNQLNRQREDVQVGADQLLDIGSTPGQITEAGLRNNVSVALQYLRSWLAGNGAVTIFNLMEDAATAEIARSQVWQWLHNDIRLASGEGDIRLASGEGDIRLASGEGDIRLASGEGDIQLASGETVTAELVRRILDEELAKLDDPDGFGPARELFEAVALADEFVEFLTLPAYERIG
jgi:malate synthase